jgi:hypothetical protein
MLSKCRLPEASMKMIPMRSAYTIIASTVKIRYELRKIENEVSLRKALDL